MAGARLAALRLVGFKSFAERTVVEFGPGISAVVGPNGSGKSNLADALRWTLGEQGRSLRTRRSEDVIFAGSSSRRAIGMADVTLVIDNQDRLLPVDYGEVEIGRRLYRSGESEYLLNRQRIRLRDLVELLDAGNLADNAFLFIGQGMVDQALALRPEERRPLFEEAAGVRRHERRRRHAEAELIEAETNLDRVRDVLAELRPQAKRLAAQAEQLQARRTAGVELAEGLLAAARARWLAAAQTAAQQQLDVDRARIAADLALAKLKQAEDEAAVLSLAIGRRADAEREQRDGLERLRAELTELRVGAAGTESELAALTREQARLTADRAAVEARLAQAARLATQPVPGLAEASDAELELVERQLAEISSQDVPEDRTAELRTRSAELDRQTRQRDAAHTAHRDASARLDELTGRLSVAEKERDSATGKAGGVERQLLDAEAGLAAARQRLEQATTATSAAQAMLAQTEAELGAARSAVVALEAALTGADSGLARAARARGATLLGEGLEVDSELRTAVSAALGVAARAYIVAAEAVPALAGRRGTVVVSVPRSRSTAASGAGAALDAARASGGGRLADAVRRDPQGEVSRLLERVLWTPDLASALELRARLAPGWRVVSVGGDVVGEDGVISLASADSVLDLRAERDARAADVIELEGRLTGERAALETQRRAAAAAELVAQAATRAVEVARQERRRTEEAERVAQRRAEQLLREVGWQRGRLGQLESDGTALASLVDQLAAEVEHVRRSADAGGGQREHAAAQQARATELRGRRDELRRERDRSLADIGAAQEARRQADAGRALDEPRLAEIETQSALLSRQMTELSAKRDELRTRVGGLDGQAQEAAVGLRAVLAAGSDERTRLVAAERSAGEARNVLREAELASRAAEMQAMEARLQLEQTREQLLVELATIGSDGLSALRAEAGGDDAAEADDSTAAETIEELLDEVVERWRSAADSGAEVPSPTASRLATLRRRFAELGAGNPFAVEEYDELRNRLELLDGQRSDMESAISSTRELIASLSALINDQFRTTFAALESAFERRFHELFGGGDAQLSMTMPDDISATGIEIHARPPGKKRQPLSMLSGGERALTAVSLLLAMLEVRPVPFCVLDEVDAALDEANVGRFSKALRGLAEQTQFIVITHNRGTIEGADALYGVTIGDDAVSRVVSLRLPKAASNGHEPDALLAEAALT